MADLVISSGLKAVLADADEPLDWDSSNLKKQLCDGILLSNGTKKFLLDAQTSQYSITYYARALSIEWAHDTQYWIWKTVRESSGNEIEVAELQGVFFLSISGKIEASKLLPDVMYGVKIELKVSKYATHLDKDATSNLHVPNQRSQVRNQILDRLTREEWIGFSVGVFILTEDDVNGGGVIEFSLSETTNYRKTGLEIKCVTIQPI